jgi:hypothetical protein
MRMRRIALVATSLALIGLGSGDRYLAARAEPAPLAGEKKLPVLVARLGHLSWVLAMAFSPDGKAGPDGES